MEMVFISCALSYFLINQTILKKILYYPKHLEKEKAREIKGYRDTKTVWMDLWYIIYIQYKYTIYLTPFSQHCHRN